MRQSRTTRELVRELYVRHGLPWRTTPTCDISAAERLRRVRLVVEEAAEFAHAMGCAVVVTATSVDVVDLGEVTVDLARAAHELADLDIAVQGAAWTLGLPLPEVVEVVHEANMAKVNDPTLDKLVKPVGWTPADEEVRRVLMEDGWKG